MKSRPGLAMPSCRPRRIWLNAVGAQNGALKEEELRKSLPYCDVETGTKNRVVERDPICGLGQLGAEHDPLHQGTDRPRTARDRENRNPIIGEGSLGKEANDFAKPAGRRTNRKGRNPLQATEPEADGLQPRGRPGKVTIRQAQRDPISGRGEFGREWDPVHKYAGRPRPWHPQTADAKRGGRCNPVTGEDAKSFDINRELRRTPRKDFRKTNPVTGENCSSFTVSDKLNEKYNRTGSKSARAGNPLTGDNCKSFDFNAESKPVTPRKASGGNPLTGDNCRSFAYSSEFKQRACKQSRDSKNPLTGNNCNSFSVSREERPRTAPAANSARCNPVTGENCAHYVLATDEKKCNGAAAQHSAAANPLTGENVNSFEINREMRVNRKMKEGGQVANGTGGSTSPMSSRSNPITGDGLQ